MFDWLTDGMSSVFADQTSSEINPASGLPMIGGSGGVDVAGNPYGFNCSLNSSFESFNSSVTSSTFGFD